MPAVPLHYLGGLTAPFARPTGTVVAGVFKKIVEIIDAIRKNDPLKKLFLASFEGRILCIVLGTGYFALGPSVCLKTV